MNIPILVQREAH